MNINKLTAEQIISLALIRGTVDYIKALDYDCLDWREWANLSKN